MKPIEVACPACKVRPGEPCTKPGDCRARILSAADRRFLTPAGRTMHRLAPGHRSWEPLVARCGLTHRDAWLVLEGGIVMARSGHCRACDEVAS